MKKTFVLCFLLLTFSSGLLAQKEAVGIEQIAYITVGSYSEVAYQVGITDPLSPIPTPFKSPVLATLTVPPSKGSTIYFEFWAQFWYSLAPTLQWNGTGSISFRILSNLIPENIDVFNAMGLLEVSMTNHSLNDTAGGRQRANRCLKYEMSEDKVDFWQIYYKDTGDFVPESIALSLLKKLIANGFTMEIWTEGKLTGFSGAALNPLSVEVTRAIKKRD